MHLTLSAGEVLATDTTTPDKPRIRGLAVPYGVLGSTSAGPLSVTAGALELPDTLSRIKLLYGHDRDRPAGAAITANDTADGLELEFAVSRNTDGQALLAELDPDAPARDGLSVELDNVTTDGDRITAARLVAVAAVPLPAYTAARASLAAEDNPEGDTMPDTPTTAEAAPAPVEASEPARAMPTPTPVTADSRTPVDVLASSIRAGLSPARVEAALSDFVSTIPHAPQWIGDVWTASYSRRPFIDSVTSESLTSTTVLGFRWTAGLDVNTWLGGKADVPSNAPTVEAVTLSASYLAGGVDVAREVVDLGSADVLRKIIETAMADYRRKSEAAAVTAALAGASTLTAAADAVDRVAGAVYAVLEAGGNPDFVFVGKGTFMALMKSASNYDFLTGAMSIANGAGQVGSMRVEPHRNLTDGQVLAGDKRSFTFYEKNPPIVVDAVDIARGGLDEAVHGYYATLVNDDAGLVLIDSA